MKNDMKNTVLGILLLLSIFVISEVTTHTSADELSTSSEKDPVIAIRNSIVNGNGDLIVTGQTEDNDIYAAQINSEGVVIWELLAGGSAEEIVEEAAIDSSDSVILFGTTSSEDFAIHFDNSETIDLGGAYSGNIDLFIIVISNQGELSWHKYIGGEEKEFLIPHFNSLTIDSADNILIYGTTNSSDYVLENPIQAVNKRGISNPAFTTVQEGDAFLTKFDKNGETIFSTFLGSSTFDIVQFSVDTNDDIVGYGMIGASDFLSEQSIPNFDSDQQATVQKTDLGVFKISKFGELLWGIILGGEDRDTIHELLLTNDNDIYLTGSTTSESFFTTANGFQESFGGGRHDQTITRISSNGVVEWSTYFGGNGADEGDGDSGWPWDAPDNQIAFNIPMYKVDDVGNLVMFTQSNSFDLYTSPNAVISDHPQLGVLTDPDVATRFPYITKFNVDGNINFSTFLTGSADTIGQDLFIDAGNNIIIAGATGDNDYPVTDASVLKGMRDIYVTKLNADGSMRWSHYYGGSDFDIISGSFLDESGNIYIYGLTNSEDFPLAGPNSFSGQRDAFLMKIGPDGEHLWSHLLGGADLESFNRFAFYYHEASGVFLMGNSESENYPDGNPGGASFIVHIDEDGTKAWERTLNPDARLQTSTQGQDLTAFVILLGSLMIGGYAIYSANSYLRNRRLDEYLINESMEKILSPIFNTHTSLIHIFAGSKFLSKDELGDVQDTVPSEIFDFKYFFHPVRMSIIKLLDENMKLTTVQIKESLGISWREITAHLDSLKKNNFITVEKLFVEDGIKSVVTPETIALTKYHALKDVLFQFLDGSPNLDKYLEIASDVKRRADHDELYPED